MDRLVSIKQTRCKSTASFKVINPAGRLMAESANALVSSHVESGVAAHPMMEPMHCVADWKVSLLSDSFPRLVLEG